MIMYREEINLRENQDEMDRARLKIFRQGLELDLLKSRMAEIKQASLEPSNPIQCLAQLLMSKEMSDITIVIPGHDENFKVHRLILSMWSVVFQAMLFGPMAEGDTITLSEDPPEAFSWLLAYMYTGETELPSVELALQVYLLANKYLLAHLKTVCSKYLLNNVKAVNIPETLNLATLLDDEALIKKCRKELEKSPDSFFSSPKIGLLSSDSLEYFLKNDLHKASESLIYQGILHWGRAHLKSKGKEITTITLRQKIEKFLPEIRFLAMTVEEFVNDVLSDNILTLKEVEDIQQNIAGVSEVSISPLFSTNKEKRKFHKSLIEKCHISTGVQILYRREEYTENLDIFKRIQTENIMYLSKIEYANEIDYIGTLIIKDSYGKESLCAEFDGRVAELDIPFQMLPGEKYTFTLKDAEIGKYRYPNAWHIDYNGLISGHIHFFDTPCFFHYW